MYFQIKRVAYLNKHLLIVCFLSLALHGCSGKNPEIDESYLNSEQYASNEYKAEHELLGKEPIEKHPSGFTRTELASSGLTEIQKNVFLHSNELENAMTKEQMQEVLYFYKWYLGRSDMLQRYINRSEPYIQYIISNFEKNSMPKELAYLAFVESGYNVKALSKAGASGLWQFMPATGKSFGLSQDWFADWRNDPYQSTYAAIEFLSYLHNMFNDWGLTISAYNAGEGKIERALNKANVENLADLVAKNDTLKGKTKIAKETLEYFPRFIAMQKIMTFAGELGFDMPKHQNNQKNALAKKENTEISSHEELKKVHTRLVDTNTDLLALAGAIKLPWEEFHNYNPALKSYITPSDKLIHIHIPLDKKALLEKVLEKDLPNKALFEYTVRSKDSYKNLGKIAGVPASILQKLNAYQKLVAGTTILVPKPLGKNLPKRITERYIESVMVAENKTSPSSTQATHRVRAGDTLGTIAKLYNMSLKELYQYNENLEPRNLKIGSIVHVTDPLSLIAFNTDQIHVVQSGDSLWSIARANDTRVDTIMKINNLSNSKLNLGQKIVLP